MELPKDVYEYLTNFADDRTILNMLSVNKKFNDEQFFRRVMERKYPLLIPLKRGTYKELFIQMSYYIAKLEEEFGIPYIATKGYNPRLFYKIFQNKPGMIYESAMLSAAEGGHADIVNSMLAKGANNFDAAMRYAAQGGHLNIVKMMVEQGATGFTSALIEATRHDQLEIVKYLLTKNPSLIVFVRTFAAGHMDIVHFLKQQK